MSQLQKKLFAQSVLSQQQAGQVEKEQEELLKKKYGGLKPKNQLLPKEHKFFDSADWALAKEGKKPENAHENPAELVPKLEPTPLPTRRVSNMNMETLVAQQPAAK